MLCLCADTGFSPSRNRRRKSATPHFVPNMIALADLYLHHLAVMGEMLRPEKEIRALACSLTAPIICTESCTPGLDLSVQLFSLPLGAIIPGLETAGLLIVQILSSMPAEDELKVLDSLRKAYYKLDTCEIEQEFV